jgi:mannose-6-phosphate isomerase-like protein (cupin superfamily)
MASTQTAYGVVSLGDRLAEAEDDHGRVALREDLDVGAFGVNAVYQRKTGETIVRDHHEAGPGGDRHEELFVVVQGSATFEVDGDTVEAPQGTAIFVRDPAVWRKATATSSDTIVLAVGAPRDHAYRLTPANSAVGFWDAYSEKDWATALEATNRGLEAYPGNAYLLYNIACMQSLLGNDEDALTALADSVAKWEPYKELARKDDDFASLREEPRFVELVG